MDTKQELTMSAENMMRFKQDTEIVAEQSARFIKYMQPAYFYESKQEILNLSYENADLLLDTFSFYRIISASVDNLEHAADIFCDKMNHFYTALYSLKKPVIYGIVSYQGTMNLVVGLYDESSQNDSLRNIIEGLLDGAELVPYKLDLSSRAHTKKEVGIISAVPSVKIGEEKQEFSLTSMMKSLNGQDFTIFFISRPLPQTEISSLYGNLIRIKDSCFAVSKRNISRQQGTTHSIGETEGTSETSSKSFSKTKGNNAGLSLFASYSHSASSTDTDSISASKNYSKTITDAVNNSEGIASDVQNGFALEMMDYADHAITRLRQGRNNGMWETIISYSADSKMVAGIIQACVSGEFSKPDPDMLPQITRTFSMNTGEASGRSLIIPKIVLGEHDLSPLCTAVTSEELGFMCAFPDTPVPNFELKKSGNYPLMSTSSEGVAIGCVCDGKRILPNMPFLLSDADLVRHTFVCGITGSGKTTTVKGILQNAHVPFLVIESAKKEYRNIRMDGNRSPVVYTLGKPEINCLRFNPFYIPCGVSPQMHIDLLKDLFNASFSFYGPMPYILEKCLQNIYKNKGWNITLGFHPYLMNTSNSVDFFEADYMQRQYQIRSHKYLFPTMQDLKEEIERYIEHEMDYEGEVAGNIKTAIKARLESLCSGSKGYMFNTYEYADMSQLLNQNTVFELEGLADDSDKAFCVGLLIIFINEYRQAVKETADTERILSHLLVIEEAHRLLKNINTERTSEDMGNPKGKAVEHFTNMIAEMRSYGQGVIVAEQIPSKLAPDVIKNSSNKIIQRLVAADDQEIVAHTIGLSKEGSILLGSLVTGTALCHKEGMQLPVRVQINKTQENKVSDGMLYGNNVSERLHQINLSLAKEAIQEQLELFGLKMLNTILVQDCQALTEAVKTYRKKAFSCLVKKNVSLVMCENMDVVFSELLAEAVVQYLITGVYSIKQLPGNNLIDGICELLKLPTENKYRNVQELLKKAYKDDPKYKGKLIIANLVIHSASDKTDILGTVKNYFWSCSDKEASQIKNMVNWRHTI